MATAGLGLMALLRPGAAARFTSLRPEGPLGVSEIRATYGGLFLALGGYALWAQSGAAFTVVGVGWLGAAVGRVFSVVVDRNFAPKNIGGVVFEAAIGALLLA